MTVRFGPVTAVSNLDLEVQTGEVFGFLGPNGAGKTTTIRSLLDLLRPQTGRVEVLGVEVRAGGGALRSRIGYLPGDLALFPFLTGRQTLVLFEQLNKRADVLRDHVLETLGFPRDALDRKVRTYSTGMRQMLGVTCAMQHDPELLVLDEPTTGLDPLVRTALLGLLREHAAKGRTVFLSSHVLAEVEDSADRVGLIHRGVLHLVENISTLRERLPRQVVLRHLDGRKEAFSHTGSPRELIDRLNPDMLSDLEIRPADLGAVFRFVVHGEDPEE